MSTFRTFTKPSAIVTKVTTRTTVVQTSTVVPTSGTHSLNTPPAPTTSVPTFSPSSNDSPPDPDPDPDPSPTFDSTFVTEAQDSPPAPSPTPFTASAPVVPPEETSTFADVPFPDTTVLAPTVTDMTVSTIISASTDSTSGVHTFTQVTTIASFRALPTQKSNRDTRSTAGSFSPNIGVIVLIVMGGLVVCALVSLGLYWCRLQKRRRRGYGLAGGNSPAWARRFKWTMGLPAHERLDSNSENPANPTFSSSFGRPRERTTPTPFIGYMSANTSVGKSSPDTPPRIHFAEPSRSSSELEARVRPRNKEGPIQRDRPPTYHTTGTGVLTIATVLPQYSAYDPSPISEVSGSSGIPLTPLSTLSGRGRSRPITQLHPLTPVGEKF